MRALILEDEPAAAENMRFMLGKAAPDLEVLAVLETVSTGTEWLQNEAAPDVIFSDIQLADGNAFSIFEAVVVSCPIVFVTAYDEYALRAFKHNGIDYLLKPLVAEELDRALGKLRQRETSAPSPAAFKQLIEDLQPRSFRQSFLLGYREQLIPVKSADIAYFRSDKDLVFAYPASEDRRYLVEQTLEQLEEELDPAVFVRANRQFIVNRSAITALTRYFHGRMLLDVVPILAEKIIISKAKVPRLRQWLGG